MTGLGASDHGARSISRAAVWHKSHSFDDGFVLAGGRAVGRYVLHGLALQVGCGPRHGEPIAHLRIARLQLVAGDGSDGLFVMRPLNGLIPKRGATS